MSSNAKGNARENAAKAILESQGYTVEKARRFTVMINGRHRAMHVDFFGCFDLMATHPYKPIRFVQVGRKHDMRAKERECTAMALKIPAEHADVEVWGFVEGRRPEGQRFRVTQWSAGEWADCEDQVCIPAEKKAKRAA